MRSFYGEVVRTIDDVDYRFVLDFNALAHFEGATGVSFFDVSQKWDAGTSEPEVGHLIAICHAALQEHHPEITKRQAGTLLSKDIEVFTAVMAAATKGTEAAEVSDQVAGKKKDPAAQ